MLLFIFAPLGSADLGEDDQLPRDAIKAASTSLQTLYCLQSHVLQAAVILRDDTDLCQALRCLGLTINGWVLERLS